MIRRHTSTRPGRPTGGQATVEVALLFPIVVFAVLLVFQLALVGRDLVLVAHAAREGARAAATEPTAGAARAGALAATTGLDPDRVGVDADRIGERVTVTVTYRSRTDLPLVGLLVPDVQLSDRVVMRIETPTDSADRTSG